MKICQSCGMHLQEEKDKGTEQNGKHLEEYCAFCFQQGAFTEEITMKEQVELDVQTLDAWNISTGHHLTKKEAKPKLLEFLPTLKR